MPTYTRTLNLQQTGRDRRPVIVSLLSPTVGRFTIRLWWNRRAHKRLRSASENDGAYFFSLTGDDGTFRVRSRRVTICADMLVNARSVDSDTPPGTLACVGAADPGVLDLSSGAVSIIYTEVFEEP